jgi:lysophospholipase L1-like esterase
MTRFRPNYLCVLLALFAVLLAVPALADGTWVTTWGGHGPLSTSITTVGTSKDAVPNLSGRTLRVIAHATTGGTKVRVRLSQRFSTDALEISTAHIAIRDTGSTIKADTDHALTFGGAPGVTVPAGKDLWSDEVTMNVNAGDDMAISFYIPGTFVPTTEGCRANLLSSYYATGDQVAASTLVTPSSTKRVFIAYEVKVLSPGKAATLVAIGDSITDGAALSGDTTNDWPDRLAAQIAGLPGGTLSDGTAVGVLNAGIGSGRFVTSDGAGLSGLKRIDEFLGSPDVKWFIVLMGVNDISYEHATAADLQAAYQKAINKVHQAGKKIIGIPILPFGGSVNGTGAKDVGTNKEVAQDVNAWIRHHDVGENFDAVLDLESTMVTPSFYPDKDLANWKLRADPSPNDLDSGDHVHPSAHGYQAMANYIFAHRDVFK